MACKKTGESTSIVTPPPPPLPPEYSNHFSQWSPFEHNFFILLTAGVGGKDNMTYGGAIIPEAVFPCTTFIDWVRVYKRL